MFPSIGPQRILDVGCGSSSWLAAAGPDFGQKLENYLATAFETGFGVDYVDIWESRSTEGLEEQPSLYECEVVSMVRRCWNGK